ncbi:hypothetical protein SLUN_00790 [Streptomyces lunaelactis]|uniref:DUF6603 domain-containing protein n=1 Tax=Streptomyces lunaelactis TaxID=1535768 RepID=A0A2R4SVW5_9ACTN|nr:DUF6603 domain-containing protein [Streptomyces lunaelactis]AVZ71006.1 hypothetical protein SLUN_00790 [Streptomyces lunaelactis]NUK25712.1 hypothetical protein [Streptomyces lunaelactis]NUK86072.1 hypothetical protein [Streptomyces lunaelactis]
MAEPGTLERLALMLGSALADLGDEFGGDDPLAVLTDLGLWIPPDLVSPALRSAVGSCAASAQELPDLVGELLEAIEADVGGLELAAKSAPLVVELVGVIRSFDTIAREVGSINLGVLPGALEQFVSELPKRLLDRVVARYLTDNQPIVSGVLTALGVLGTTVVNPASTDPVLPETTVRFVDFARIGEFFSSPETAFSSLFGWGTPAFDGALLIDLLYELLTSLGLPVASGIDPGPPERPFIEFFLAALIPTDPTVTPPGLDLIAKFGLADGTDLVVPVSGDFLLGFSAAGAVAASTGIRLQPPANLSVIPPEGTVQGTLKAGLDKMPAPGREAVILLGVAGATELSAKRIGIRLTTSFAWDADAGRANGDVGIEGAIEGGELSISLADADGFIGSVMAGFELRARFDLGFGWRAGSAGSGVYFTGSGGLDVQIPAHIQLGPIEIKNLTFRVGIETAGFPVGLMATIKAALGPLQAVVESIGVEAVLGLPPGGEGNLGPIDLGFRFKPPNGIGLSLDVGVVKGGGYLFIDTEKGEYAGALELVIAEFLAVAAIGLITTRNPDGSPGFSMLIIITAQFPGGIQLGYGFTLLGVGGLLGINRTMNLQALMEGVRTGAVESVMFPRDVVANAPRILSDLRAFFPAKQNTFLIGPMIKIGWGSPTLISASVGVIIEIPGNVAIVGVLKVALPTPDEPLVQLQVNFAGTVEFDRKRLYFFASLFDSRILFLTIAGEMGLLVAWGDQPEFVVSVGGFHPSFDPPPLPFPSPQRITISILDEDWGRIRITNYFAITSNTAQFGAAAELYFRFSGISIEGHIGFDALFRFSPFYFVVEISASVSLKVFGLGVFSIHLHFALEGTSPWRARGEGSISFFFFDVSADFDETWGEPKHTELDPVNVLPLLRTELEKAESWRAFPPPGTSLLVSLRSLPDSGSAALALHPVGVLEVRQRAVPLDIGIAKVGSNRASDATRFTLTVQGTALRAGNDVTEPFAMAQFLELDDAAKLSRPSFERQHAGMELVPTGAGAQSARMARRVVRFEEVTIDDQFRRRQRRFRPIAGGLFAHFVAGASIAGSPVSAAVAQLLNPHHDAVAVTDAGFVVASTADNRATTQVFGSEAAAREWLDGVVAGDPSRAGTVHVIPTYEAATA